MTKENLNKPRIYVACLAAYNSGILHGAWIDATQSANEMMAEVRTILKASPESNSEEWAIHDYENFEWGRIPEFCGLKRVHQIANFIEEHGSLGAFVLIHFGEDIEEATEALEEDYQGEYANAAEFAQHLTEEIGTVPENLSSYIDYESMARDMEWSGDIFTIVTAHDEVHVFWCR